MIEIQTWLRRATILMCGLLSSPCAEAAEFWPGFRGTTGGQAAANGLPVSWSAAEKSAEDWTIALPGYGQSSPVIWNQRIFVTAVSGPENDRLHMLAVDLKTGKILWQIDRVGSQPGRDSENVSRAASTAVVDSDLVYFVFETGDIFAFTHQGEPAWERSFVKDYGKLAGSHGYASSPVLFEDLCLLQVAHSGPSYILALDRKTGANRWKVDHPSQTGWSTPTIVPDKKQPLLVVSTAGSIRALEVRTGQTVWVTEEVQGNSTASPTVAGEFLIVGASTERGGGGRRNRTGETSGQPAPAPRPESTAPKGSLVLRWAPDAKDRLVWQSVQVSTGYASPVVAEDCVYFVNRVGVAQCVDLKTGATHWQHRLPGDVWASPIAHHGMVTFFGKQGAVMTLKAGPELVEVAESQIISTDTVYGVGVASNSWIVRTGRGLQRINAKTATP